MPDTIRESIEREGYFLSEELIDASRFTRICSDLGPIIFKTEVRVESRATSYFRRKDMLPYHTDSPMARLVAWLCLAQQETGGDMRLKDTKPIFDAASPLQVDALRQAKARFPKVRGMHSAGNLPVLAGDSQQGWRLNYAPWLLDEETLAPDGAPLVEKLDEFPDSASVAVTLRPGSLLVIDNRRMLHGRDALQGEERVLLRFWIGD